MSASRAAKIAMGSAMGGVIAAAVDYVREVECPVPDLLERARLRDILADRVRIYEAARRAAGEVPE